MTSAYFSDGMSKYFGSRASAVVPPTGSGADDATAIRAALDSGLEVVLKRRELYTLVTTLQVYSWDKIRFNGAIVDVSVPRGDGVTAAGIFCATTDRGTTLTLAANTTVGARSFTVTSRTDLVDGGEVVLADPSHNCLQAFKIKTITGSSNPFTVNVDRRIKFVFTTGATSVYSATIPRGIYLDGDGAEIIAAPTGANVSIDRGFELGCLHDGLVEGFLFRGAFVWGLSFDDGSFHSTMRDIRFDASSTYSAVGFASECNEDCAFEDICLQDVSANSLGAAYVYSGINNRYRGITARDCAIGFAADTADVFPCDGCTLEGSSRFDHCGTGLAFSNGSKNWKILGARAESSTSNGVLVNTSVSGVPTGLTFKSCDFLSNGNDGILLSTGADVDLIGCRIGGNGHYGAEVLSGVTRTRVNGGRWDSNALDALISADDLRVNGLVAYDNGTGGIRITGSANAWILNTEIVINSGSATWQAFICQSSGEMSCENCKVGGSGFTGNKSAVLTTDGTIYLDRVTIQSGITFGLFRNGGGSIKYNERLSNSATTVRTGGSLTTTSSNEASYA